MGLRPQEKWGQSGRRGAEHPWKELGSCSSPQPAATESSKPRERTPLVSWVHPSFFLPRGQRKPFALLRREHLSFLYPLGGGSSPLAAHLRSNNGSSSSCLPQGARCHRFVFGGGRLKPSGWGAAGCGGRGWLHGELFFCPFILFPAGIWRRGWAEAAGPAAWMRTVSAGGSGAQLPKFIFTPPAPAHHPGKG